MLSCVVCALFEKSRLNKLEANRALNELVSSGMEDEEHLKVLRKKIKESEDAIDSDSKE